MSFIATQKQRQVDNQGDAKHQIKGGDNLADQYRSIKTFINTSNVLELKSRRSQLVNLGRPRKTRNLTPQIAGLRKTHEKPQNPGAPHKRDPNEPKNLTIPKFHN